MSLLKVAILFNNNSLKNSSSCQIQYNVAFLGRKQPILNFLTSKHVGTPMSSREKIAMIWGICSKLKLCVYAYVNCNINVDCKAAFCLKFFSVLYLAPLWHVCLKRHFEKLVLKSMWNDPEYILMLKI